MQNNFREEFGNYCRSQFPPINQAVRAGGKSPAMGKVRRILQAQINLLGRIAQRNGGSSPGGPYSSSSLTFAWATICCWTLPGTTS
jgi:hypothetical protein